MACGCAIQSGRWLAIGPAATANCFETKDYAKNCGLVFTADGIGAVIGGIVSAQAKDLLGAYQPKQRWSSAQNIFLIQVLDFLGHYMLSNIISP